MAVVICAALLAAPNAMAAFVDIGSPSAALTHIYLSDGLQCQAFHQGDSIGEFFGTQSGPASCGTSVAVPNDTGGSTVYGFNDTALTPVSQSRVAGTGTRADPLRVTTVASAGATGVQISQTDSHVIGQELYRTDMTLTSPANLNVVLYHAGDCYLQGTDAGYGAFNSRTGGIYCTQTPNNNPSARILGFTPLTPGSQYHESRFSSVFAAVSSGNPLPNICDCTLLQDNGAGISWSVPLAANTPATYSLQSAFSPTGQISEGPPPPVLGKTVNVFPVSGRVLVALPLSGNAPVVSARRRPTSTTLGPQRGYGKFVSLPVGRQIPVRSLLDTSSGTVRLVSAADAVGGTQSGDFSRGAFQVQSNTPLTTLNLLGGRLKGCPKKRGSRRASAAKGGRRSRQLFSKVKGKFRTNGHYSAATVRGTQWLTTDTCVGTRTDVKEGSVSVRDFLRKRTVTVTAGHSYLARARKR